MKFFQLINDTVETGINYFYSYFSVTWKVLKQLIRGPIKLARQEQDKDDAQISAILALLLSFIFFQLIWSGDFNNALDMVRRDFTSPDWFSTLAVFLACVFLYDLLARLIYWIANKKEPIAIIRNTMLYQFNALFVVWMAAFQLDFFLENYFHMLGGGERFIILVILILIYGYSLGWILTEMFGFPEKVRVQRRFLKNLYKGLLGWIISGLTFIMLSLVIQASVLIELSPAPVRPISRQCSFSDGMLNVSLLVENAGEKVVFFDESSFSVSLAATNANTGSFIRAERIIDSSAELVHGTYVIMPGGTATFTFQPSAEEMAIDREKFLSQEHEFFICDDAWAIPIEPVPNTLNWEDIQ